MVNLVPDVPNNCLRIVQPTLARIDQLSVAEEFQNRPYVTGSGI